MKVCSISECGKPQHGRGWCDVHYTRWRKHGNPLTLKRTSHEDLCSFLESALHSETDSCIVWPYSLANGYPQITIEKRSCGAHIIVLERTVGSRPKGKEAAHSCGVSGCINPRHLRWATPVENAADRRIHGTENLGTRNHFAKITEIEVLAIRSDPRFQSVIADEYNITQAHVSEIKARKKWGWLE